MRGTLDTFGSSGSVKKGALESLDKRDISDLEEKLALRSSERILAISVSVTFPNRKKIPRTLLQGSSCIFSFR